MNAPNRNRNLKSFEAKLSQAGAVWQPGIPFHPDYFRNQFCVKDQTTVLYGLLSRFSRLFHLVSVGNLNLERSILETFHFWFAPPLLIRPCHLSRTGKRPKIKKWKLTSMWFKRELIHLSSSRTTRMTFASGNSSHNVCQSAFAGRSTKNMLCIKNNCLFKLAVSKQ